MEETSKIINPQLLSEPRPNSREAVLGAMLTSTSVAEASRKVGVHRNVVLRWMRDPDFKIELAERREAVIQGVVSGLVVLGEKAVEVLSRNLDDTTLDASDQIRAANAALNHMRQICDVGQSSAPTLNVLVQPQWVQIQALVVEALEPFPEAQLALADALETLEPEEISP